MNPTRGEQHEPRILDAPHPIDSTRPILTAVLDAEALREDPGGFAYRLFNAGVDWIQLRERTLTDRMLFEFAREVIAARDRARDDAGHTCSVIVNKRVDLAIAAGQGVGA